MIVWGCCVSLFFITENVMHTVLTAHAELTRSATLHNPSESWSKDSTVSTPGGQVQAFSSRCSAFLRAVFVATWKPAGQLSSGTPNKPCKQEGTSTVTALVFISLTLRAVVLQSNRNIWNKYEPGFSPTGPASCEVWHWKQHQQVTMSWRLSADASTGFCALQCKANLYTQTFCSDSAVCPVDGYWSLSWDWLTEDMLNTSFSVS